MRSSFGESWHIYAVVFATAAFAVERAAASVKDGALDQMNTMYSAAGALSILFQRLNTPKLFIGICVLLFIAILAAVLFAYRSANLKRKNAEFRALLVELDAIGKLLVRRDVELSHANQSLTELDMIKSEFVSIAAHQLRTPLTGIKWTLNSLHDGEFGTLESAQQSIVKDALTAANYLVRLISDLLNVARLEEGRFGFKINAQPLPPVITEAFENHRKAAEAKEIAYASNVATDIPPLKIDAEKIRIVLENLLDNAVKYTPAGGSITLTCERTERDIVITVTDTGIGIPEAQQYRLFSKFFRSANAQLVHPNGTGLGLYLSKAIAEQHGGSLTFTSAEGRGTSFRVALPYERAVGPVGTIEAQLQEKAASA